MIVVETLTKTTYHIPAFYLSDYDGNEKTLLKDWFKNTSPYKYHPSREYCALEKKIVKTKVVERIA